jgi:hypothetical protein
VVVSTNCPYSGLANSPFHSLVSESINYVRMRCPTLVQNAPDPRQLCNYCATHCKIRKVTQQNLRTSPPHFSGKRILWAEWNTSGSSVIQE